MAQTWRRRRAWLLLHLVIWSDCGISALRDSYTDAQAASLDRAEHEDESSDSELLAFGRTPLSSSLLQALFAEEASSATASQLQARVQLQAATGRLRRSTVALTELLTNQGDELVEMLHTTEATADEFAKAPKDPKMIQHALQVSKQMVDLVNEVKSSDKAIQQSLAKTGDPLVYDDGSINRSDIPDPGEEVGRLAEGIAKLARKRGDDKMLKKTEGKIVEHMIAVEKMVDGAKEAEEVGVDPRDMLADEPENDTAELVESFSTDAAGSDTDDEGLVAESWEIDEMDVDSMDAFTRAKICELLPSLRCDACGENASTLQEYRDCVGHEVVLFQESRKLKAKQEQYRQQLDETVQRTKGMKKLKRKGMLVAHDALQIWGIHRNWARWTSDPTWPLDALKGEPAKAGWQSFSADSQVILDTHIAEFQTGAVDIAKEEAAASGDTLYAAHLEDHVGEAMDIKTGGEDLMARGQELQQGGTELMADAQSSMAEAQAIQADSAQLQADMQQTSQAMEMEIQKCQQPPTPLQPSQCDPQEINRLANEMDAHRAEAESIAERGEALGEEMQVHSEEAQRMAQDAEAMAADAEELKTRALVLKDEALADLTSSETLNAVASELKDCAKRITTRVLDLAAQTARSMTSQILALVPDLFLACLEAALDIITGFGWIITAARLTYMLTKYAIRKWREWRDARPQKLCAKAPQLDCCVDSVMAWYDRQALAQRQTEAEFRADSQDLLARALQYPNSCTPWSVTLYAEPPDDETLKVLLAREMEQGAPGIFTRKIRTHLSLFGVTSGWTSLKRDARLVVARSTFMIEWPRKEGAKHAETLRFSTSCEDFIPIGGKDSRDTKGLRAKFSKGVPLGIRFKFGGSRLKKRSFEMTTEDESMCFLANAMCRAACYRPEACDDYLDPEAVVDLQGKAAQNVNNLLKLCAPVAGLARATGVKPGNFSLEHSLGPVALRPFVWHHLFHQGQGMPVSRTEAMAYSAAVCDKHVLPHWTCGTEECSLCQGVASMYSSSQNAEQWCTTFQVKDSENTSDTYARDLGRYYKCHYLSEYLESTEDKNRLSERKATIVETCQSRTFCSEKSNTLPTLDMRPGLRQGTPEYADSQCRLCVEFVQRAAAGLKPKAFCNAIPSMYQQQRAFCEGTLEEMMAAIPGIKNAQERAFWSGWFGSEWSAGLAGDACNRLCQGAVKRNPGIKKTLKNPSPLLMAGEDSEPAPPGEASENWQPAATDTITKSPWMKKALKSVKVSLPLRAVSGTQVVIWRLEDQLSGAISGWEALLKEIAWDGTFTQKRVWPRTGPTGVMSKKVQEAVFLMIREASLLRSHVNFISAILETKLNLRVAVRTAEDLVRRMDLLVQNFDAMDQVLDGMKPSKVPSRFRRRLQKRARDQERLSVCYAVVVERHETYMPILDELSQSLRQATDKLLEARQRGIRYSPKDTGLLDTLAKFYLVLPAEEQTRFTRLKQWLNPLNLFRTKLRIDKLVEQDSKDCSFRKVRKMTQSGVWKEFQSCCTERTQQVLGWETNIRNVNIQINKILDMMNYVKGNFVTRNIRKAYRAVRGAFVGADRKRGIWVEEEAADLLNLTANDFRDALEEERRVSSRRGAKYKRLTEEMFNSIGDRGIRRGFFRELRYDVVKRNARKELKEGKEHFLKIRSLLNKLASRIAVDEENFPEITDEGNSSFEEVKFVIVESGRCEDEPHRRKASNLECRNRAMQELGFTFKEAMYFRSATPAGCVTYGGTKAYFRDIASGGDCGSRGASCICAVRVAGASNLPS